MLTNGSQIDFNILDVVVPPRQQISNTPTISHQAIQQHVILLLSQDDTDRPMGVAAFEHGHVI